LTGTNSGSAGEPQATADTGVASPKVFVNYRHEDAQEPALRLYDRLERRFGAENVFLDVRSLGEGSNWLEAIKQHGASGNVFLALIGSHWLAMLRDREPKSPGDPQDYVVLELALALGSWPGKVIPVLLGSATMPGEEKLPKRIRALARIQAMQLRPLSFDADAELLLSSVSAASLERAKPDPSTRTDTPPEPAGAPGRATPGPPEPAVTGSDAAGAPAISSVAPTMPPPDASHYNSVLKYMLRQGSVVPVLGSGVRGSLPDARELASRLAKEFELGSVPLDLAEVAQRVMVANGPEELNDAIAAAIAPEPHPDDTHLFLARFPRRLEELGLPKRYQMIVTTNYDSALEQAFEAVGEEYDLAVFLANGTDESGTDRGKFLHVPSEGAPEVIHDTSKYFGFPLNNAYELERTLIVKISGAAEGGEGGYRWDRSYVLTEDQYIDYLVADEMIRVVPAQILNKLKGSHCLFLGYEIGDWSLRVFLKRIWRGQPLRNKSWAIKLQPDALERDSWAPLGVQLLASSPDAYVHELDTRMPAWLANGA
jgi:SIR2-like domain/TIR domain